MLRSSGRHGRGPLDQRSDLARSSSASTRRSRLRTGVAARAALVGRIAALDRFADLWRGSTGTSARLLPIDDQRVLLRPSGQKTRAVKARYVGVCRGCGAYTQPRNGKGMPRRIANAATQARSSVFRDEQAAHSPLLGRSQSGAISRETASMTASLLVVRSGAVVALNSGFSVAQALAIDWTRTRIAVASHRSVNLPSL
jgi:hypothetical protein